ncbi:MAG: FG-GAP-like repeat-containing protein [Planctomycetota bacterium]
MCAADLPRRTPLRIAAATAAIVLLTVAGCSDAPPAEVVPPAEPVRDLELSETEALRFQSDVAALVASPMALGKLDAARRGLVAKGFVGAVPGLRAEEPAGDVTIGWLDAAGGAVHRSPEAFLEALFALAPLDAPPERIEVEVDRFELDPRLDRATGRIRFRWAGPSDTWRLDATVYAEIEARRPDGGAWQLARFVPCDASDDHPLGAGAVLRAGAPRFVDRTAEVGLTFGTSDENRALIQTFVDRHRTLTLGGLTVCDFDGDERPDVIATRSGEQTILFRNDGSGGFVPEPLPIERYADRPAFVLFVDLDGDGREEIVASETSRYEGGFAYAGLWTRTGAEPGTWRHLPRAFELPNPVGLRRLAVQTVVPLDVEGDGDLDLFFAVYGSGASRGDEYNTVEAFDGADNHLVINQGGLTFTEESEARGITGTGYTYVALAFDADHDGDTDLFEGNDFGPNVLWRNEDGTFVEDEVLGFGGVSAYTMGAALADLEADGRWDLYVSNMSSEEGMRMVPHALALSPEMRDRVDVIARGNALYSEPASGVRWPDRARQLGINEAEWAWGCQFLDVNGDGALELAVTNGFASHRDPGRGDWQTYYWRQVIDDALRLERGERSRNVNADLRFMGSFNGHERDRLFVRTPSGDPDRPWVDAGWCLGLDASHDGRALATFDPDGDGDLDVVLWALDGLVYYENVGTPTDWVRARLEPNEPPLPALGARVAVASGGRSQRGHVALVEGFQSQVLSDVHFGLARGSRLDALDVEWPGGGRTTVERPPRNRVLVVREDEGLVGDIVPPRWPERSAPSIDPAWSTRLARLVRTPASMGFPPAPLVVRVSDAGPPGPGPFDPGVLDDEVVEALNGVRFMDVLPRTGTSADVEHDATRVALVDLETVADAIGGARQATIVYDANGRPMRIFRGEADPEHVAAFCRLGLDERAFPHLLVEAGRLAIDEARYRDAVAIFESAVTDRDDLAVRDAPAFEGLGRAHVLLGRVDLAEAAYRRSVELDPDYAIGHINLGAALSQLGRFGEATDALVEARRVEGDTERVLGALAEAAASADRFDLARECATAWLRATPGDAGMTVLLGKVEARAGRLGRARQLFEEVLLQDPGNAEARRALERTLELLGAPGG